MSIRRLTLVALLLCPLALFATRWLLPAETAPIQQAWERAQRVGSYQFRADIEQTIYPTAALTSVGQPPTKETLYMEGQTNSDTGLVELRLNPTDRPDEAIELRIEQGQAMARVPGGAWQPFNDLSGSAGLSPDVITYLAGASNVASLDSAHYRFDFDGNRFAMSLQQRLEDQLRAAGKLPAGVSIGIADHYRRLRGHGELALDSAGLPQQMLLDLEDPARLDGPRSTIKIATQFSGFDHSRLELNWLEQGRNDLIALIPKTTSAFAATLTQLCLLLLLALLLPILLRGRYQRPIALAMVLLLLASAINQAILPSAQASAAERISAANANLLGGEQAAPWNPQTDPLAPNPSSVDIQQILAADSSTVDPSSDTDGDGLTAIQEQRIGTAADLYDTDGDGISDGVEVRGYADSFGTRWYLNPIDPDMDRDWLPDGLECPELITAVGTALASGRACVVTNTNYAGGGVRMANPTHKPDVFNLDSDGDGLTDREDFAPRAILDGQGQVRGNSITPYTDGAPFSFIVNQTQLDSQRRPYPTFVDFQVRTSNPRNMTLQGTIYDWPTGDHDGQLQRMLPTTFADGLTPEQRAADPRTANGDLRLLPMLEVRMRGKPLPMPLTTPRVTTIVQGQGAFSATLTLTQNGANIDARFTAAQGGSHNLAIVDGSCGARGTTKFTWNSVTNGATRSISNARLLDWANGNYHLDVRNNATLECNSILDLPNGAYTDKMIDTEVLKPYSIVVRDLDAAGTVAAYLPVTPVAAAEGGLPVAFAGRMPYLPNTVVPAGQEFSWGQSNEARLLWMVQMRADRCKSFPPGLTGSDARSWCLQPANREDYLSTIQTYYDDWYLSGMAVVEDHGFTLATVYEQPSVETSDARRVDDRLWAVADGLQRTFLNGSLDANGIKQRWDSQSNGAASNSQRWGIPQNALGVSVVSYPTENHLPLVMMKDTPALLNTVFQGYRGTGSDAPTLLFASRNSFRRVSLDLLAGGGSALTISQRAATIAMNPTIAPEQTIASLTWSPYRYRNGAWESNPTEEYVATLGARLRGLPGFNPSLGSSDLNALANDGLTMFVTGAYQAIALGVARTVRDGAKTPLLSQAASDDTMTQRLNGLFGQVGAVPSMLAQGAAARSLEAMGLKGDIVGVSPATWGSLTSAQQGAIFFAGMRHGRSDIGNALTPDWMTKLLPGRLATYNLSPMEGGANIAAAAQTSDSRQTWAMIGVQSARVIKNAYTLYKLANDFQGVVQAASVGATTLGGIKFGTAWNNKLGITGTVLAVSATWAAYGVQMALMGSSMSDLQIAKATVDAVVTTIVLIAMLIISTIPGIGQLIAAVIAVIDGIVTIVCLAVSGAKSSKAGSWLCGGITGLLAKAISWVIIGDPSATVIVGNLDDANRLQVSGMDFRLLDTNRGLVTGNSIRYSVQVTNTIEAGSPDSWMGRAYDWQFNSTNLRSSTFDYTLQPTQNPHDEELGLSQRSDRWQDIGGAQRLVETAYYETKLPAAGVNRSIDLFLSESFIVPTQECWSVLFVPVCKTGSRSNSRHYPQHLVIDVLPATLGEFTALARDGSGYTPAWCSCGPLRDADGDGLVSPAYGGPDPNDGLWDASQSGVSDQARLRYGITPGSADADNDGLKDFEELWYGTNPTRADGDLDGLTDKEELNGWLLGYDVVDGVSLEALVTSDPYEADADHDGLSDLKERIYGTNPRLPSSPNVLSFATSISEGGTPRALLRFNESSGALGFQDSSGFNNTAACAAATCPVAGVNGRYGAAAQFNGAQFLSADGSGLSFSGKPITLMAWVKPNGGGPLISRGSSSAREYDLSLGGNGVVSLNYRGLALNSSGGVPTGQWSHVAASYDGSALRLFINGQPAGQQAGGGTAGGSGLPTLVGGRDGGGFNGQLDDVAIFDWALSPAQITSALAGSFNLNDQLVPAGGSILYEGQVTNQLYNRFARGLLFSELPPGVNSDIVPLQFNIGPQAQQTLAGTVRIGSGAPSGPITLRQKIGALIVDPLADLGYVEPLVDNRLLTYLPFNEPPATAQFRNAANGLAGTCAGSCPISGMGGRDGQALRFDGSGSTVQVPGQSNLAKMGFAVAFWARRPTITNQPQTIVSQGSGAGSQRLQIGFDASNRFVCGIGDQTVVGPVDTGTAWTHWACDYVFNVNKGSVTIYRNGAPVKNGQIGLYTGSGNLVLGHDAWASSAPYNGLLDELRVYVAQYSTQVYFAPLAGTASEGNHPASILVHLDESIDATSFENTGTSTVTCTRCPQSGIKGVVGQALEFKGDHYNHAVGIGDQLLLDNQPYVGGKSPFTFSAWIKPASNRESLLMSQHYLWNDGLGLHIDGVQLQIDYTGKLTFKRRVLNNDYQVTGPAIPVDRWTQVTASHDGTTMRLYVNGIEQASKKNTFYIGGAQMTVNPLTLGSGKEYISGYGLQDDHSFVGLMDEVALFPRALSAAEIRENYRYQLAWVEEQQEFPLMIDGETPTSQVVLSGTVYLPNSFRRELITSSDITSQVALAELGVKRDDQANISWSVADPCQDAAGGMAWCPSFDPAAFGGEGRYTLQSRATDITGNREAPQTSATIYVDASPPQAALVGSSGVLTVTPHLSQPNTWVLKLRGTVSDPNLRSGDPGSGVASLDVTLLNGQGQIVGGSVPATIAGSNWTADYLFTNANPTGSYQVKLDRTDKVGNSASSTPASITLDMTSPSPRLAWYFNYQGHDRYYSRFSATSKLEGMIRDIGRPEGLVLDLDAAGYGGSGSRLSTREEQCSVSNCDGIHPPGQYDIGSYGGGSTEANSPELNLTTFSIGAWVKQTQAGASWQTIIDKSAGGRNYGLLIRPDNIPQATLMADDCSTSVGVDGTAALPLNIWTHLLASYDGTTLRLYRNGALEAAAELNISPCQSTGNIVIGSDFIGVLDEVEIYNRALLEDEIRSLLPPTGATVRSMEFRAVPILGSSFYQEPPMAGRTFALPLDDTGSTNGGLTITDGGGQSVATCNGATCPQSGAAGHFGRAMLFDGEDDHIRIKAQVIPRDASFSVSAWTRGNLAYGTVVSQSYDEPDDIKAPGSDGTTFRMLQYNGGRFECGFPGYGQTIRTVDAYPDTDWVHWVCTYDRPSQALKLYHNGAEITNLQVIGTPIVFQGSGSLRIGREGISLPTFKGAIDDVQVFDHALSPAEIQKIGNGNGSQLLSLGFDDSHVASDGSSFADSSPTRRTAVLSAGAADGANKIVAGANGNYALQLDGIDDQIALSQINLVNSSLSAVFWAKRAITGQPQTVVSQGSATNNQGLQIGFRADNRVTCSFWGNELNGPIDTGTGWTHWACTYNATTGQRVIYRNGVEVARDTPAAGYSGNGNLLIGGDAWGQTSRYKGALDDLQLYQRAINPAEIRELVAIGWKPGNLIVSSGRFRGGWQATLPTDLEGFYQLDLRGTDASGNFGDTAIGKNVWRGEIDTAPPRISIQRTYTPNPAGTASTSYVVKAEDFNLDLSRVALPCPLNGLQQHSFSAPWYQAAFGQQARIVEVSGQCTYPGNHATTNLIEQSVILASAPPFASAVKVVGTTAYIGASGRLSSWNISNPAAPQMVRMSGTFAEIKGIVIYGSSAYIATNPTGLRQVDLNTMVPSVSEGQANGVDIVGDKLYAIFGGISRLEIIQLPNVNNRLGTYYTSGTALGLAISSGNSPRLAHLTFSNRLEIIDVTNPASPQLLGSLAIGDLTGKIVASGNYAYAATSSGLKIIDVSDPANPQLVTTYSTSSPVKGLQISGARVSIGEQSGLLSILDVSTPGSPQLVTSIQLPAEVRDIAVSGSLMLASATTANTRVLLASDSIVCDTLSNCSTGDNTGTNGIQSLSSASVSPQALEPIETAVLSPTAGLVLTSLDALNVSVSARADANLSSLQFLVDNNAIDSTTPTTTSTSWSVPWTPAGAGAHILTSVAEDSNGNTASSAPVTITVDLNPPQLAFATTVLTSTHMNGGQLMVTGSATDESLISELLLKVTVNGSPVLITPTLKSGIWTGAWPLASTDGMNGGSYAAVLSAVDQAGRSTTVNQNLTVDIVPPTASMLSVIGNGATLVPGSTVAPNTPLQLAWGAIDDGSATTQSSWLLGDGVSDPYTTTLGANITLSEPRRVVGQLALRDTRGNVRVQQVGPFYVDGPMTPDYIALNGPDGLYTGWSERDCTQLGADRRIQRSATEGAALGTDQQLFASWNASTLRLAWAGANWDSNGDLFIYLDTQADGTATAYNPYSGDTAKLYLPGVRPENVRPVSPLPLDSNAMQADALIWATSSTTATLLTWNGTAWAATRTLTTDEYRFSAALQGGRSDIALPFSALGIGTSGANPVGANPLGLVAFASEDSALRLWATLPSANPLSSARINSISGAATTFALNRQYSWPDLRSGVCPSGSQGGTRYSDSDLAVTIEPNLSGMSYSFLGNRLTSLWSQLFGAQGASATELATRFGTAGNVLRDGQAINYTLRYRNNGSQTARGLVVALSASHALRLTGQTQLALGDLAPGEEKTIAFSGAVNLAAARSDSYQPCLAANVNMPGICLPFLRLARVRAEIRDETYASTNAALDWAWADHAVDGEAPQFFGIDRPNYTIGVGAVATSGYAYDPAGVASVKLEIQTPNGGTKTVVCPDAAPRDGLWSCAWNATQQNGSVPANGATFKVRMLATDGYGQASTASPWRTLIVDTIAPTFTRNPVAQPVAGSNMAISGSITDNYNLGALQACLGSTCVDADLTPLVPFTPTVVLDKPAPIAINGVSCAGGSGIERGFTVGSNFAVGSVQLELAITHARRGELAVKLIGPDNTQVRLLADDGMGGGEFANYNVLLDDRAAASQADALANDSTESVRGRRPFEPLRAFYGKPSAGVWRVQICDTATSANQGQYLRGTLTIQPVAEIQKQASWSASIALPQGQDAKAHTLVLKGSDAVGNQSQAVSQSLTLDNVAPKLTIRQVAATSPVSVTTRVLEGTVSDGGTISKVLVMVRTPSGETYTEQAAISGGSWSYALMPKLAGDHILMVVAVDAAGNMSSSKEYTVKVGGLAPGYRIYLPLISR